MTTVDVGSKRRRMPWWAVWAGKGLSVWIVLVLALYFFEQLQQSMMGSANKIMGGKKRVGCVRGCAA